MHAAGNTGTSDVSSWDNSSHDNVANVQQRYSTPSTIRHTCRRPSGAAPAVGVVIANSPTHGSCAVGCFLGSGLFGYLCDRCGRRKPLLLATAITAAATFASLAAPNYWVMAAARAVVGFGAAGQNQCAFLLCSEVCGPAYRYRTPGAAGHTIIR